MASTNGAGVEKKFAVDRRAAADFVIEARM
jgi:hypothetical protein